MRKILYGYTRNSAGEIVNYHPKSEANTIHTFTGGGHRPDNRINYGGMILGISESFNHALEWHGNWGGADGKEHFTGHQGDRLQMP